jgi:hypothetical protein
MPATTPRGYPYSLPADPADVPQAIEDLAEAIDPDVQARADSVSPREVFRLSSTTIVSFSSTFLFTSNQVMPFDVVDANVGGGIAAFSTPTTRIVPRLPGFWWFQGSITFPRASASNRDLYGVTLRQNGTVTLGRAATHIRPPAGDGSNNITCTAGTYFNGTTDYLELLGSSRNIAFTTGSPMNVRRRYLLAMRMTTT